MVSAQDFWQERLGRFIFPSGPGWRDALMAVYPHADPGKTKARMGGSEPARFLISDAMVQVWAPVRPNEALPPSIQFQTTASRRRRDWIVDVLMNPPQPPFLAASVGMSGADAQFWKITTSAGLIAFGGAAALFDGNQSMTVDRDLFVRAKEWFAQTDVPVSDLLRLSGIRQQFKSGLLTGEQARARIARIKTPVDLLVQYPGDPDPTVMKLAAYAATDWETL